MTFRRLMAGWAVIALAATGVGCATVRRAREAQAGRSVPPGERLADAAEAGLVSGRVLTLDQAVRIAVRCHPSVAQARQNLAVARAQVPRAAAGRRPAASASAGYSRATSNTEGRPSSRRSDDAFSASLSGDLLVYDFGAVRASERQALARLLSAEQTLAATLGSVALGVREAFFGLGRALELRQVAEESVRQYRTHLDQVRAQAEVGRRTRYDVTKADVDWRNAELALVSARHEVTNARAALNRAMGLAEDAGYEVVAGDLPDVNASLAELMEIARSRNPELLALRAQEKAAGAAVDAAIADLYPRFSLSAQYRLSGTHLPLVWNLSAAVQTVWRLLTGGQRTAAIDEAVAQLGAARARLADREAQLALELTRALNALDGARERLRLAELTVRSAEESAALIEERYRVGAANAVEVTDAQASLTSARAERVKARFEHQISLAQILNILGEEP